MLHLPELHFEKTTLANGLDVIVRRQAHLPVVAVNLWYHVGSKNEERRQRGFAHLFEHLMFEGSEHYPGDFFKYLQPLGAQVNGSTSPDRTNYFEDLPSAHTELALAMESDRMGHFLPALSDEKLRIQKDVVQNEYRQNYANRPYGQVFRIMAEALYPSEHPYSWLTIGAMEDVEAATRSDVESFFRRFYVPSNASLCLVGDLEPERGFALADRYFGPISGGVRALQPQVPVVRFERDVDLRLFDRVELDRVYLVWHSVPHFERQDAPLALLGDILARGRSSRLYRKLVMELGLAQDVSAYQAGRELGGTFGVVVTLRPGQAWEHARDLVDLEIDAIAQMVTPEELERVRTGRLGNFLYALDNVGGFGGVADRLNAYNVYLGDPGALVRDFERFQAATAEEVQEAARAYLQRPAQAGRGKPAAARVELVVLGRRDSTNGVPLDRSTRPTGAPAVAYRAPVPEVRALACGAELWVLPRRDLPIVAGTIAVLAGSGAHGAEQGGLASLTAAMLDEGTATRSALDLAREAESRATSLASSCGHDGSYVSFQCLTPHLEATLDLAADLVLHPSFPSREWDRVRGQTLANLQAERDRAEARAYRGLLKALFGPEHPYHLPALGTRATVERLGLDALREFHDAWYRPNRAAVVIAGDVDPDQLAQAVDQYLGDWNGQAKPLPTIAPPEPPHRRRIFLLNRPGAAQAVVRVGHVGIDRLDPAYTDLMVFNQILGGQFISRLNTRLREQKGYTYGVRSSFDTRRGAGPFSISTSVQPEKVADALSDLVREVEDLLGDRPPTTEELEDARRCLVEGQARQFETPSALVSRYAGLFLYGFPPDHHTGFADRLAGVSLESMVMAATRAIRPYELIAVIVADADLVAEPLRHLGWAAVDVVEEDRSPSGA